MDNGRLTCPTCKGRKQGIAFVKRQDGCNLEEINCYVCKGLGWVTKEHQDRIAKGEELRRDRINRGLSLRREAVRLGISPVELGRLERGEE